MRTRFVLGTLAVIAVSTVGTARIASAGYVAYDHFDGESLDTALWSWDGSGSITQAESVVTVYQTGIGSTKTDFGYGSYEVKFADAPGGIGNVGFNSADWSNQMLLRNDVSWGNWGLYVKGGGVGSNTLLNNAPAAGDVFDFVWSASQVQLLRNGHLEATVTAGIPAEGMGLGIGGGYGSNNFKIDYVGTVVPEPSAVVSVLSGVIAMLAYAWRMRR